MSDWIDNGWQRFMQDHAASMADLSVDYRRLVKKAWLHGAAYGIEISTKTHAGLEVDPLIVGGLVVRRTPK